MGYLHRMVTCPKCGRKIPWRDTVSDDGTCRDCEGSKSNQADSESASKGKG
jgi:adenine-specific DNA methylase